MYNKDKMFKRVLIVESYQGIADMLECALWLFGYRGEVYMLSRMEEVEEQLCHWHASHVPLPDLLLLDVSLREQKWRVLLNELSTWWPPHEKRPATIVMTTGQVNQEEYQVPVLRMPFHVRDLQRMLCREAKKLLDRV